MTTGITGSLASLRWVLEPTFNADAMDVTDTIPKVFGRGQRLTSFARNENMEAIYELGKRVISYGAFKQTEGTLGLEWVLSNPWFLYLLLGKYTAPTEMAAPFIHTFDSAKRLPTFRTRVDVDLGVSEDDIGATNDDNVAREVTGCVLNQVTISAAVGELVKCRADALFAKEQPVLDTFEAQPEEILIASAVQDTDDHYAFEPYTFVHCGVYDNDVSSTIPIAEVQSFELTLNNNAQLIWGLGDNFAVNAYAQALDLTGRLSVTFKDAVVINKLRTRSASYKILITNDPDGLIEAGINPERVRTIEITGQGLLWNEHSTNIEPNALVLEDIGLRFENISVATTNQTEAFPGL